MKKFNYTVSIEAPSKEIADMLIEYICKDNIDILEIMKNAEEEKEAEHQQQSSRKESIAKTMADVQKVIQIIGHCMTDETALDRIAELFGVVTNLKKAKQ